MKNKIIKILLLAIVSLNADITYKQAMQIPTIKNFTQNTGFKTDRYLREALKNKEWQEANKYFYDNKVTMKLKQGSFLTIPYHDVIRNLKSASDRGIVLAMYQGYKVSLVGSRKKGKYAKKDLSYFAKQLMERGVCLGYIETAYGYSRGWYRGGQSWTSAHRIMTAGESSCKKNNITKEIKTEYRKYKAQFEAMSKREKQ